MICENCYADVPKLGLSSDGKLYCCPSCLFHPLGCRCKFGELGVANDIDMDNLDDEDDEELDFYD